MKKKECAVQELQMFLFVYPQMLVIIVQEIRYSMHSYELDRDFKILPSYMGHYHILYQNRRFAQL